MTSTNEKCLLEDITDTELATLECPTYERQEMAWQTILDSLTHAKVDSLVKECTQQAYSLVNFELYTKTCGVINKIFILNVVANRVDLELEKQLILRIKNPHEFWTSKRCENEVTIMRHIKAYANQSLIPVPLILSHSFDAKTSLLKCEYILME